MDHHLPCQRAVVGQSMRGLSITFRTPGCMVEHLGITEGQVGCDSSIYINEACPYINPS